MKRIKFIPPRFGKFRSGIWNLEKTEQIIHSDTLFSAICNNYSLLYGKLALESFLNIWKEKKDPIFTSMFPFIRVKSEYIKEGSSKQAEIYFYPKPNLKIIPKDKKYFKENFKKWKRIEFISESVLLDILSGNSIDIYQSFILADHFLISKKDKENLTFISPFVFDELATYNPFLYLDEEHVILDRISNSSSPFFVSFIYCNEKTAYLKNGQEIYLKTGLYCLWKGQFPEKLKAAVQLIADEGIGGKRYTGSGLFNNIEIDEISPLVQKNMPNTAVLILSIFYPSKLEFRKMINYSLIKREGFIYSSINRTTPIKSIHMITEGSIASDDVQGNIIDVTPDEFNRHRIYKYGLAFSLPVQSLVE